MRHTDVPDELIAPYPKELLRDSLVAGGLRYLTLGEEAETIAFLGHPPLEQVIAAAPGIAAGLGLAPHVVPTSEADVVVTMGWLWTSCPVHATPDDDELDPCAVCAVANQESWWLSWDGPHGGREGFPVPPVDQQFPVTIWATD
jgi:hypothetical protein